jgi:hypothetical protein
VSHETGEVPITCEYHSFIISIIVDHGLEHEFCIYISFGFSGLEFEYWLEDEDIARFLEKIIEILIGLNISNKEIRFRNLIFFFEIDIQSCPIKCPSLITDSKIYIL